MSKKLAWTPDELESQSGKHFVVTGANGGIGFTASKILASKGAEITMLCRSQDKAEENW